MRISDWSSDVCSSDLVQLTTSQTNGAEFGIRGNINNSATLVLGRRITPGQNLFGNSLVGQTELIDGVTVRQVGDFTQQASGTIVAGITPTLVRVYRSERSEEHTSELQSLMRISYAVFCLKKKKKT